MTMAVFARELGEDMFPCESPDREQYDEEGGVSGVNAGLTCWIYPAYMFVQEVSWRGYDRQE